MSDSAMLRAPFTSRFQVVLHLCTEWALSVAYCAHTNAPTLSDEAGDERVHALWVGAGQHSLVRAAPRRLARWQGRARRVHPRLLQSVSAGPHGCEQHTTKLRKVVRSQRQMTMRNAQVARLSAGCTCPDTVEPVTGC